jgi:hypothetical protein
MEPATKYIAILVSFVPNNHCELCSYFDPHYSIEKGFWTSKSYDSSFNGFKSPGKCPSCNRICYRYFIPEDAPRDMFIRVPDTWKTKPHLDPKKLKEATYFILYPRENYDPEYWKKYTLSYDPIFEAKWNRIKKEEDRKRKLEEKEVDMSQVKTIKRKLKF